MPSSVSNSQYTISITKGVQESVSVQLTPSESVAGWSVAFRAKSSAVNPDTTTATILARDLAADATTILVNSTKNFPLDGPFKVRIDNEVLQVTDGVGWYTNGGLNLNWAVERGMWGTTAAAHAFKARVSLFTTPQMLLDTSDHGGVTVEDEDTGLFLLSFDSTFTGERPIGTYWWTLNRTDPGLERVLAAGLLYLLPNPTSAFTEPPLHNS
jgi:hypothetical protein